MIRSPFVTLAAVVVFGLVLVGVDMAVQHPTAPPTPPAAPIAAPAASAAPAPAAAPAGAPESFPAGRIRYVGDVTSQGATIPIAVTVDGDRSKAYVCDGHQTEAWLQGGATTDAVDGAGRHGNHMTGRLDGGRLTGTVSLSGRPDAPFTAAPATDQHAGIYRSSGGGRTTGWIVQQNSGQVGLSQDASGAVSPPPPLPLDGPLPAGVVPVDGSTDVLATS